MMIELTKSDIVTGNAHVTGLHAISKIDAYHGFELSLFGHAHKIKAGRGVVDIGEHEALITMTYGLIEQCIDGIGAVA